MVVLIKCRNCKLQYTGQINWNNYRCCAAKAERSEECKQKYLHEHFLQDDHHGFLNHAHVTLKDKTQASNPNKRVFFDENP